MLDRDDFPRLLEKFASVGWIKQSVIVGKDFDIEFTDLGKQRVFELGRTLTELKGLTEGELVTLVAISLDYFERFKRR